MGVFILAIGYCMSCMCQKIELQQVRNFNEHTFDVNFTARIRRPVCDHNYSAQHYLAILLIIPIYIKGNISN